MGINALMRASWPVADPDVPCPSQGMHKPCVYQYQSGIQSEIINLEAKLYLQIAPR